MIGQNLLNRKNAILLIPYFGKWPEYFPLFLSSSKYNQWLEIMFITDCPIPDQYPENVSFKRSSLTQVSKLISTRLNFSNYELPAAYKLCDFKPTYGVLFKEYITHYKYWAFGDIDLIYGDLGPKVKSEIDLDVDIISLREEIISGSLTLIKNNEYNNSLFKKLENFNDLIISTRYEGIDETSHNEEIWFGLSKLDLPKTCFTYLVAKEHKERHIIASFRTSICEHLTPGACINFFNSNLFFKNESISYFHFVMNKRKGYFTYPKWKELPHIFYIFETGFYKNRWIGTFIGPIKKYIYLSKYYLVKAPHFLLKVIKE